MGESIAAQATSGSSGGAVYQDGDIGRTELRVGKPYQPDFVEMHQLVSTFGEGSMLPVDRSQDVLLTAGPGYSGLGADPGSMESLRRPDGVYRLEISGTSESPVTYGAGGTGISDGVIELPPGVITGRRMTDAEMAAYDAEQEQGLLQAQNDAQVIAGTYGKFGAALDSAFGGNWSQAWFHLSYTPSGAAKKTVYDRVYPRPNPALARFDKMIASPIGAGVFGVANLMGASQRTQDGLLGTFGALEQIAGARTGVYKQTLTAGAPIPGTAAAASRSVDLKSTGARYAFDAAVGRYREVESGQFVAARNLPWPSNAGFESSARHTVGVGTVVDRYGSWSGRFLGEPGATVSQRGMAPGSQDMPYTMFRVVKPFDAQVGPAAGVPDFGATGGAKQYLPGRTIQQLVDQGFLEIIK